MTCIRNSIIMVLVATQIVEPRYTPLVALASSPFIAAGATYGLLVHAGFYQSSDTVDMVDVRQKVIVSTLGMCAGIAWKRFLTGNIGHQGAWCTTISLFGAILGLQYAQQRQFNLCARQSVLTLFGTQALSQTTKLHDHDIAIPQGGQDAIAAGKISSGYGARLCMDVEKYDQTKHFDSMGVYPHADKLKKSLGNLEPFISDNYSVFGDSDKEMFFLGSKGRVRYVNPNCLNAFSYFLDEYWHLDFILPNDSVVIPVHQDKLMQMFLKFTQEEIGRAAKFPGNVFKPYKEWTAPVQVAKVYAPKERQLLDAFLELLCIKGGAIALNQFNAIKLDLIQEIQNASGLQIFPVKTDFQQGMQWGGLSEASETLSFVPHELRKRGLIKVSDGTTDWIVSHMIIPQQAIDDIQRTWESFRNEQAQKSRT